MNELKLSLREKIYCNWYLFKSDLSKDKELVYLLKSLRISIILSLIFVILHDLYLMIYLGLL